MGLKCVAQGKSNHGMKTSRSISRTTRILSEVAKVKADKGDRAEAAELLWRVRTLDPASAAAGAVN